MARGGGAWPGAATGGAVEGGRLAATALAGGVGVGATAWILRLSTPIRVAARGCRARAMLGLHAPMALKESAG